ncbi:MAG: 5-(carboxyamino)imidazole ribonucleotide synthase, partial [Deltaproteobacteria bacterium]|nr:5-(carboxyamino)imidazole ribonucleotide synthase [Deltaproteobacteria bacterium]
ILGGGQLGRMLAVPARQLGYTVNVLAPLGDAPALGLADHAIRASFEDLGAARQLAAMSDVVTYEFENVPAATAQAVAQRRALHPSVELLATTQDRNDEHAFLDRLGIPTAPGRPVHTVDDLDAAITALGYPSRLKSARGGYDGGGQFRLHAPGALDEANRLVPTLRRGWRLEGEVAFERELSVLVARSEAGEVVVYPPFENEHQDGILHATTWPASGSPRAHARALEIARTIAEASGLVGLMCVECFVAGDEVRVNELAPRVHNSGHLTIEGATVSQFETHVRAICGLPLLSPEPVAGGVAMVNLLGHDERKHVRLHGCDEALRDPRVHVHLYGKDRERPRRKMGHVTATGLDAADARARAERAAGVLRFSG